MITPLGWLERVPTYKDQQEQLQRKGSRHLRLSRLSAAAERRHPDLPARIRAGGRGPGGACRDHARGRAALQSPLRPRAGFRGQGRARHQGAGRPQHHPVPPAAQAVPGKGRRGRAGARRATLVSGNTRITVADRERLLGYLEGSHVSILPEPQVLLTATPEGAGARRAQDVEVLRQHHRPARGSGLASTRKLKAHADRSGARAAHRSGRSGQVPGVRPAPDLFGRDHAQLGGAWLPQRRHRLPGVQEAADREGGGRGHRHARARAGLPGQPRAGQESARRRRGEGPRGGARTRWTTCAARCTCAPNEQSSRPETRADTGVAPVRRRRRRRCRAARAGARCPSRSSTASRSRSMPRDLYIPPQALEVFLEAFEGPLDLLLYLIRRQNLDVLDIPIAEITRQYMRYIELMQELQLELAGEYLVMAATLAEIKSRMLLPRPAERRRRARTIRAPSWCAACRNTSASSAPRRTSTQLPRLERDVLAGQRRAARPAGGARAAAGDAAGDAAGVSSDVATRCADVRASPRAARTAVGARAHERRAGGARSRANSSTSCACSRPRRGAWA